MEQTALTPQEYIDALPPERREVMNRIREEILKNIDPEFSEQISYGMIGYVIPHSVYPAGYHCNPKLPLPFLSIASQKNFVAFYHMGMYSDPKLLDWFVSEFPKHSKRKLDMGKSCVRFKNMDEIPFALLGELVSKMTASQWIDQYESVLKGGNRANSS